MKNRFKKVISILAAICMLFQTNIIVFAAKKLSYDDSIQFINKIGLMDMEGEKKDEQLTRGEAAKILYDIYFFETKKRGAESVSGDFFGDRYEESEKKDAQNISSKRSTFLDVNESNDNFVQIESMYELGLINGMGDGNFEPDLEITSVQFMKMMYDLMGYKEYAGMYGGYPKGYDELNNKYKITNGVKNGVCTKGDAAKIICNTLETETVSMEMDGVDKRFYNNGTTLMEKYLFLKKTEGFVSQNEVTSLTGASSIGKGRMAIDDIIVTTDANTSYAQDYIGRNVICYYFSDDSVDAGKAAVVLLNEKKDPITFDIKDFEDFSENTIKYYEEGKARKVNIASTSYMILNGFAKSIFSKEDFAYKRGNVTVTSSNGSTYDTIILTGYETVYVAGVDYNDGLIINKLLPNDQNQIKIDSNNVKVLDTSGNKKEFTDIKTGDVLNIARNGDSCSIIVSNEMYDDFVIKARNGDKIIGEDGKEYLLSKEYEDSQYCENVTPGYTYKIYIDKFGDIAYAERIEGMQFGYAVKWFPKNPSNGEDWCGVRLLNMENQIKPYHLQNRIRVVYDKSGVSYDKSHKDEDAYNLLKDYTGVVRYKEKDGIITYIETALPENFDKTGLSNKDRLYIMAVSDDSTKSEYTYKINAATFGGKVFLSKTSPNIYNIPEGSNESDYKITHTIDLTNDEKYNFVAYGTNVESIMCENIVLNQTAKTNYRIDTKALVVTSIEEGLDSDDAAVTIVRGIKDGKEEVLYSTAEKDVFANATTPFDYDGKEQLYQVEEGDIIRYTTDSNGTVNSVQIIYSRNTVRPDSPSGKKGWILGAHADFSTDGRGNPYAVNALGVLSKSAYSYGDAQRIMYGYVYSCRDGIVTVSTQNLSETEYNESQHIDFVNTNRPYVKNGYLLKDFYYINCERKDITVTRATQEDIKDYISGGNICSKALVISRYGEPVSLYIIDDNN